MCSKLVSFFVVVLSLVGTAYAAEPFLQDTGPDGIVSMEAENFDENIVGATPNGDRAWEFVTDPPDFSGAGSMQALPDSEGTFIINDPADYLIQSPRLDYKVRFTKVGTHYVWFRGYQTNDDENSCHIGLNGIHTPTADRAGNQDIYDMWLWNGESYRLDLEVLTINIPSAGEYILNVWMREDGFILDKLVLTTNPDYVPEGEGPLESPRGLPENAGSPRPLDQDPDVPRDVTLSWSPGIYADTHDVYFGSSFDDVNDASRDNPLDVLVSQGQDETMYDVGRLEFGQTYFWRVDEVNAPPDNGIWKGPIWDFTVEPFARSILSSNITATASSEKDDDSTALKTVDGSGLDDNDGHSRTAADMWLSASGDQAPSIQYEFDRAYPLDHMLIWNSNQAAEGPVGYGVKDVQIETSMDGNTWNLLEGVTELTKAPGQDGAQPTDTIDLSGIIAKFVRFTIGSNWGGILTQYSLSEVRFYYIPLHAREPIPSSGATGVRPDAVLSWRAGRQVDTHDLYINTDQNAVADSSAEPVTLNDNHYDLLQLDLPLGETFFWKVNEVNALEDPSVWEGNLWTFSLPSYLVVDNFESYSNDSPKRPFQTWIDGIGYSEDDFLPANPGNNTGAAVGHDIWTISSPHFDGDILERALFHGGKQSLPLYYDNSGANGKLTYSETTRTFTPAQDWTPNGISTLTLYFRGVTGNTGQLYIKVNDTKVLYTDDAEAIARHLWTQWNIDLTTIGTDLTNVQTLTLGLETEGSGLVYFDDILLYRDAPPIPEPVDPGNTGLFASYSMENSVADGSGNGYDGTAVGNPNYDAGPPGFGTALVFDGVEDTVELPIGSVIASLTDFTFAGWVNFSNNGGLWQRIFDFGSGETNYMFLTPANGGTSTGPIRFALLSTESTGESLVNGLSALPTGWHHVAAVVDSSTMDLVLYMDGSEVGRSETAILPRDLGETTQNWLGRSQFEADAFFGGSMDEILLYDRALTVGEIRYLVGER